MLKAETACKGNPGYTIEAALPLSSLNIDIPASGSIPGHTLETYPDICRAIAGDGHELALHGYTHENLNVLPAEEEQAILWRSYRAMEKLTQAPPKGFRSPAWDISSRTITNLAQMGILYDSSQMGQDYTVYHARTGDVIAPDAPMQFGRPTGVVEIPVSWSLDDYPYFEYLRTPSGLLPGLRRPPEVFENWMEDVQYMLRDYENGVLTATFHPQVSGRGHRLLALEKWIDALMNMGLRFSRLDAIAEQFQAGQVFGRYMPA